MIKAEIKRSVNIKIVIVLILIGMCSLFSNAYSFLGGMSDFEQGNIVDAIEAGISDDELVELQNTVREYVNSHENSYMAWRFSLWGYEIVCILLATSVFAHSYRIDNKSGVLKNIILRVKKKKYFSAKYLINAFMGGFIVTIPVAIVTIVFMIRFGVSELPTLDVYFPYGFMSSYFSTKPIIYMIFFTAVLFFIGATYSTFAMAVAVVSKNMVSSVLIPLIYWFAGSLLVGAFNLYSLAPWNIYYFYGDKLYSFREGLIHTTIIFIISSVVIYMESRKEEI